MPTCLGWVQNIWTLHILDTSRNTTLLGSKVRNKKLLTIWKALWGCSMHLHIQLKSWFMTQFMSQQIPSIKLRLPTKQSYLIIYYIFYLIKISIFLFSFFLFLFSHLTIIHFFCPQEMERNNKNYLVQATDLCICTSILATCLTILHTFSHTFSTTHIFKKYKQCY